MREILPHRDSFSGCLAHTAHLSVLGLLATASLAPAAHAGYSYVGSTKGKPYAGKGIWGTRYPSGPLVVRAHAGQRFDRANISPSGKYVEGELLDEESGTELCVTLETKYLVGLENDPPDKKNPCNSKDIQGKDDFEDIGKDINYCRNRKGQKIMCVDGEKREMNQTKSGQVIFCRIYDGFAPAQRGFDNMTFPDNGSGPYGYAGVFTGIFYKRYTREIPDGNGNYYTNIRTPEDGWVWTPTDCIRDSVFIRHGTDKNEATVPGHNPNGRQPRSFFGGSLLALTGNTTVLP